MKRDYKLVFVIGVLLVITTILATYGLKQSYNTNEYNRLLKGQLTSVEQELQSANTSLGLAESKLVKSEDINVDLNKDFKRFIKKHKLQIQSKDTAIAKLTTTIDNGTTTVVERNNKIEYTWEDKHNRFKLYDPDVLTPNNEIFTARQMFIIEGEIYKQTNGLLQTRRLILKPVFRNAEGAWETFIDTGIEVVASEFKYAVEPPGKVWYDIIDLKLRVTIYTDFSVVGGVDLLSIRSLGIGISGKIGVYSPAAIGIGITYDL